jgi:hypothetical protein
MKTTCQRLPFLMKSAGSKKLPLEEVALKWGTLEGSLVRFNLVTTPAAVRILGPSYPDASHNVL